MALTLALTLTLTLIWTRTLTRTRTLDPDPNSRPDPDQVTEKEGPRKASVLSEKQQVAMPPALPAALADVRSDASPTDWYVSTYVLK